jgi:hypothetical protein
MGNLKYKVESALRDLKSIMDEAIKLEAENDRLEKEIVELKKDHAKEIADITKKQA